MNNAPEVKGGLQRTTEIEIGRIGRASVTGARIRAGLPTQGPRPSKGKRPRGQRVGRWRRGGRLRLTPHELTKSLLQQVNAWRVPKYLIEIRTSSEIPLSFIKSPTSNIPDVRTIISRYS
eukprot:scaffold38619_cov38-Tisochrysis_lutea.AAC.3